MTRAARPGIAGGMIRAFFLSVAQLGDRRILVVLAQSLAMTLAIFGVLGVGVWWGTRDLLGGDVAGIVALAATVAALWLLFQAVAIGVMWPFVDRIVAAVEARHYPAALASARPVAVPRAALMGLASAARLILANLILLPAYLALLVTGVGTAVLFLAVNGWVLGRDLGDMVAARHLPRTAMRGWRKASGGWRFLLGVAVTALFVVPVLGLLAPVLGAAMATHLFHQGREPS